MSARDELATVISTKLDSIFGSRDFGPATQDYTLADAILAAGYTKPRTITDHYADGGTDSLRGGTVILSHGEALLAQSDGTFCDPTGSTWDFWELELPITVLHEPAA